MTLFRRSASHQRVMELEAAVERLQGQLLEESGRSLAAEARASSWKARYEALSLRYAGALMAVRVLMLATKAKPLLVYFSRQDKGAS